MKKSCLLVFLLTLFCLWAVAGGSDPPINALTGDHSADQEILGAQNLIVSGLAEGAYGDVILFEECPLGYTIFGQIPATIWDPLYFLVDSDLASGATVFDNFWGLSEDICGITWWGLDVYFPGPLRDCTEDPMDFEVAFYPDDGSGSPDTLNPIYVLPSVTPMRTPTGQMYGPWGGWIDLNRYDLELDPCVSATEGWFSVKGISTNGIPEDCFFIWVCSPDGDLNMWYLMDGWNQLPYDVSFCLQGQYTPTYGACCDLSTGICQDNVEYQDCPGEARFEADVLCAELDPPCGTLCEEFTYSLGTFTSYEGGDPVGWHWTHEQGNPEGSASHPSSSSDGCDDWLISPGDYTVGARDTLMWDQMDHNREYITYHGVLISSDYISGNDPTTATWTELYTGAAPEYSWETISVDLSAFAGETVHIAFRYQDDWPADRWWVDNVCIVGRTGGPACDYIAGDCDHNGTALELGDVIAMISMYRGSVEPYYVCDCPPHGDTFAPEADPSGNCVAFELGDVVTEIGAYRGTTEASGCVDCPGSLRLLPGGEEMPLAKPSLKAKSKIEAGSSTH